MDVFDWSIPFLSENITAVMKILLGGTDNKLSKDEDQKFRKAVAGRSATLVFERHRARLGTIFKHWSKLDAHSETMSLAEWLAMFD